MKFKEFEKWCVARACDGCWGKTEAAVCCDVMAKMNTVARPLRELVWKTVNEILRIDALIVEPTNEKIKQTFAANE